MKGSQACSEAAPQTVENETAAAHLPTTAGFKTRKVRLKPDATKGFETAFRVSLCPAPPPRRRAVRA